MSEIRKKKKGRKRKRERERKKKERKKREKERKKSLHYCRRFFCCPIWLAGAKIFFFSASPKMRSFPTIEKKEN